MKKVIFGSVLMVCATIGLVTIVGSSFDNPLTSNGRTGLDGFLFSFGVRHLFNSLCVIFILGALVSFHGAYFDKDK